MNAQAPLQPRPAPDMVSPGPLAGSRPNDGEALSLLPGVNVLLQGPGGTGKTYALGTIADAGVDVFLLFLESGLETTLGYWTDRGLEIPSNVHWHVLDRSSSSFETMAAVARDINRLDLSSLAKMSDINRAKHNQFVKILEALHNFPDDRTGAKFGDVHTWGPDRALCIDGLAGLNSAAMSLIAGGKPVKNQSDYGIAMDQLEKFLKELTEACHCHFVLISHVEREVDLVLGGVKLTVSTLGNKLAPKIPPMFSDVILAKRLGDKFTWSTADSQAEVKTRNLAIAEGLPPSFAPILFKWKSRGGAFTKQVKS